MRLRDRVRAAQRSPFVREMQAALRRRLDATSAAAKRAVDREMAEIMRRHLAPRRPVAPAGDLVRDFKLAAAGAERE